MRLARALLCGWLRLGARLRRERAGRRELASARQGLRDRRVRVGGGAGVAHERRAGARLGALRRRHQFGQVRRDRRDGAHGALRQRALEAAQPGAAVERKNALLLAQRAQLHNATQTYSYTRIVGSSSLYGSEQQTRVCRCTIQVAGITTTVLR